MKTLTMLVGPPGSGKSTMAKNYLNTRLDVAHHTVYVNQDSQGKFQHMENFRAALRDGKDIIVDRMNFNKAQRNGYLEQARALGYHIVIRVLHVPYAVCLDRAIARVGHETIKDETNARQALNFFFKTYERVEDWEADSVCRHWPVGDKPQCIIIDLDGTLCNMEHRRHHVRGEGKKNWMAFMDGIPNDTKNQWCHDIIGGMDHLGKSIVLCSGRGEEQRKATEEWLLKEEVYFDDLFMRQAGDSRRDDIVKEIILDFEILCRYTPCFMIDDRPSVCRMWRKRDFIVLQCQDEEF